MWITEIFKKKPIKLRILFRTYPDGRQEYVIQKKGIRFFRYTWRDASCYCVDPLPKDSFNTLNEAENNLWIYDGSHSKSKIIKEY